MSPEAVILGRRSRVHTILGFSTKDKVGQALGPIWVFQAGFLNAQNPFLRAQPERTGGPVGFEQSLPAENRQGARPTR